MGSLYKKINTTFAKAKRKALSRHLALVRFAVASCALLLLLGVALLLRSAYLASPLPGYWSFASGFLLKPSGAVDTDRGRTNILLLGKDKEISGSAVMTDTIILVSVPQSSGSAIKLISVPRDIWVADLEDKINSAYHRGNEDGRARGLTLAKSAVREVLGVPVHYAIAVDFEGFGEIIDLVGGVEVAVERSFTDERFPISGLENDECGGDPEYRCRYKSIAFTQGVTLMDGQTALEFSRSRHSADPDEGNDIARGKRQQLVLSALKQKLFSRQTLASPVTVRKLILAMEEIIETDMDKKQLAVLARIIYDNTAGAVPHTIPDESLYTPPYLPEYRNLFIFLPVSGNWDEVHDWVVEVLFGEG